MNNITFCIPSKNNLRYLKACIPSIRKNSFNVENDIIVFVDEDNDGTVEWLESIKDKYNLKYIVNDTGKLYGIGRAYDKCIEESETEIFMIFHADMMLAKYADYEAWKHLEKGKVICSTRIEPPLHLEGPEKIVKDFGLWPEPDVEDGWREKEFDEFVGRSIDENLDKITKGCFAPWMMYKEDFLSIGGHDPIFHSCREDSDVFNRLVLKGYDLIQSWTSYVYHLTARAGQFQHGKLTKDHSEKSSEWRKMMDNSTREYFRKWGCPVLHDEYMMPIIPPKYDIGFVVHNIKYDLLHILEPWCSTIYIGTHIPIINYVSNEGENTKYNLQSRVWYIPEHFDAKEMNDIIVEFDADHLTNENFNYIQMFSRIIQDSGTTGKMELDIFKFNIFKLKSYEKELINCK